MNRANRNLATMAAILRDAAAPALSEFELAAIDEISARRAELGDEIAMMSPAEITHLIELVDVMKKYLQAMVAQRRHQFGEILARLPASLPLRGYEGHVILDDFAGLTVVSPEAFQ